MNKTTHAGIAKESWDELIHTTVAFRAEQVIALRPEHIPPKESKKLRRRLKASHNLHLENETIWHSSGTSVPAIASWTGIASIEVNERCNRYKLLGVDRHAQRLVFAIPINMVDKLNALPSTGYSAAEVKLLCLIADEVSGQEAAREYYMALPHPAKNDILWQRDRWYEEPDREALIEILRQRDWLIPVIAAALDVQLRSFKFFRDGPLGIYNITLSGNDLQADENFCSALHALNFTAAPSFMGMAVPEIFVRDKDDLRAWRSCHDRLILLRTATGSLLKPLFDEIDERERIRYCGGLLPPRLQTVPIVRSKTVLHRRFAADITLPKGEKALTVKEQNALRGAMGQVLNRKVAQTVYDQWRRKMASPQSYWMDPFVAWQEVLETVFLASIFKNEQELIKQASQLLTDTQAMREQTEIERTRKIKEALELLSDPSRYEREIVDRPKSKQEARSLLDSEQTAVAFRFSPSKGDDAGLNLLAFSPTSLKRLLRRTGCGDEMYDAVLTKAEQMGLLDQRSRTIRLDKDSFAAVTFNIELF